MGLGSVSTDDEDVTELSVQRPGHAPSSPRPQFAQLVCAADVAAMRVRQAGADIPQLRDGVVDRDGLASVQSTVLGFRVGVVDDAPHTLNITRTL